MGRTCLFGFASADSVRRKESSGADLFLTDSVRRKEGRAKGRQRSLVLAPVGSKVSVFDLREIVC